MKFTTIGIFIFLAAQCFAQYCYVEMTPAQKNVLDSVMTRYKLTVCCGTTLGKCMEQQHSACPIVPRLTNFACFLSVQDMDFSKIKTELGKRVSSHYPSSAISIPCDTTLLPPAGAFDAPVTVVVIISASCPMCKRVTVPLYSAVTEGLFLGKARLVVSPYSSRIGDRAYIAANKSGKFWKYFLALAKVTERIEEPVLISKAEWLGISGNTFKGLLEDKNIENTLERNYTNMKTAGINVTPAIFINGKRYLSDMGDEWIMDAIEYEYIIVMNQRNKNSAK